MIKTEIIEGVLVRSYSDAGFMISGGDPEGIYTEAIDPAEAGRTYTETDIPCPVDPETDAGETDYLEALKQLGVE